MNEGADAKSKWAWLLWVGLLGVCALAVLPFLADAKSAARVPQDAEMAAAVQAVRADFKDGDAVWVEPSWWVLPRHALERMGAGTDTWPFPALMTSEDFDPVEAYGYERLFVVSGFGREPALPPELAGATLPKTELMRSERTAVARYEMGPPIRLRTLSKEWTQLEVARRYGEDEKPCRFKNGKHRCGRDSWLDVGPEARVVWRREVEWLFTHPGPDGSLLDVSWPKLERTTEAGPTWFYLRIGQTLEAVRHPEGGNVAIEVFVDGQSVDRFELLPQRFWMERRAIKMPSGKGPARVTVRVSSVDPGWRETVMEADVLTTLPETLRAWATNVVE